MIRWSLAILVGLVAAWLAYGPRGSRRASGGAASYSGGAGASARWWLALLRAAAVTVVAALLIGAPAGRPGAQRPLVAVDVSASWRRAAGDDSSVIRAWRKTITDSISALAAAPPLVLVGDSLREAAGSTVAGVAPLDAASRMRPAVELAAASGRPLIVITDGEVDDADALREAPPGSRVLVMPRVARPDVAVAELAAPSAATGGDTLSVAATVVSGGVATPDGTAQVLLDRTVLMQVPIPALAPFASTRISARLPVPRGTRTALLQVVAQVASDVEPRNDTLRASLEIGDRPSAVFVSTAPDLDVREVLTVLRGALDVPTRAYLRVAPGTWRVEGSFAPIAEAEVRARANAAGMLIVHGDTSWVSGPPNSAPARTNGARALWVPAPPTAVARAGEIARTPEWYVNAAPPSPVSAALTALPFDSLPPITLAGPARGMMPLLTAQLGKRGDAIAAVAAREERALRTAVISGSGWAGWSLRSGRSRDAFTAFWGALFDWLAAGRGDLRAARPIVGGVRAGEPVVWRRGGADTVVAVRLVRRDAGSDTAGATINTTLHFTGQRFEATSAAPAPGVYDVSTAGGTSVLVVNAAPEWVPRAPTVSNGAATAGRSGGDAPRLSDAGWPFVLALLLLCAEWIARRFAGQR